MDPFSRSKKVTRTPQKDTMSKRREEEQEEDTNSLLRELLKEMKCIRADNKEFRQEMSELKKENNALKKESEEAKERLTQLESRMEHYEKEQKKNNVIVSGMEITSSEELVLKEGFIKQHLQEEIRIESAIKLGKRTCLIRMTDNGDKSKVSATKSNLRYIKGERIYLNDDLTTYERKIQKEIRETFEKLKENGKEVKRGYKSLTVDGEKWKWDANGRIKKELLPKNVQ